MRITFLYFVIILLVLIFPKIPYCILELNKEIKHHFIRDYIQKGIFDIKLINTNEQLANIFIKSLCKDKLIYIRELMDIMSVAIATWCERIGKVYRFGWEKDYNGIYIVEDALLRPNIEGPYALNKMCGKALIFQQMLNKGILHKACSKDHLSNIHFFALFHMMTEQKFHLPSLLFAYSKRNLKGKGIKKNHMTYFSLLTKIFWDQNLHFGKNNIAPMKLDTIKLTLPPTNVNPSIEELEGTSRLSKKHVFKCKAPTTRLTKASAKKQRRLILQESSIEEVIAEVRATIVVEEAKEIDDDNAPLITRMNMRKTPLVEHQGTQSINPIVLRTIPKEKKMFPYQALKKQLITSQSRKTIINLNLRGTEELWNCFGSGSCSSMGETPGDIARVVHPKRVEKEKKEKQLQDKNREKESNQKVRSCSKIVAQCCKNKK
ncbi:hypothetical protein CR513_16582, partial [Mucuna pruriens]